MSSKKTYTHSNRGTANISDTVYTIIHNNIVNLKLAPGIMISEKDISEKLQVSRTPVREAFIRLSHEALVNILPQKGTFVSKIDLMRVQEERFLRESLESAVLEIFVKFHTEESIDRLKKNLEKQKNAINENDIAKFVDYDDQFHSIMFDETRKHLCYRVIQSFSSHYRRIRYLSMYIADVSKSNIEQHQELIDAISAHNAVKANDVMKKHIRKLILEKDEICEKYPEYFQQEELFIDEMAIFDGHSELKQLMSDTSILSI